MHRHAEVQGRTEGWVFQASPGWQAQISDYDLDFQDWMVRLHVKSPHLFLTGSLLPQFVLRCSLRRGAVL